MARSSKIRSGTVKVDGLRELNRALKAIGPEAQKELKEASKTVATFVAADARSSAFSQGGVLGHIAPSIKPVGGVSGAGVAFGGAAYPMAGGAEFGSIRYKQFKPWRGNNSDAGYAIYPAIRQDADRIVTEFTDAVDRIIKKRFPLP
jgi:hypothetical protein